ncbi:MAG: hypothetical protein QXF52_06095 [Thermoproteota archaeon]
MNSKSQGDVIKPFTVEHTHGQPKLDVLFLILKLLVILFPIGAGLYLTNLGTVKLNEATVIPLRPWSTPYGFLSFSSIPLHRLCWSVGIGEQYSNVKSDICSLNLHFNFELFNASGEQVIGFQLPGEFLTAPIYSEGGFRIEGYNEQQLEIPINIVDQKVVPVVEEGLSIVYIKFVALPNVSSYHGHTFCTWKGLTTREGYSAYSIVFPVANSKATVHQAVYNYFPEAYTYYGNELALLIQISLPENCELRRVYPLPDVEEVTSARAPMIREFCWESIPWERPRTEFRTEEHPDPASDLVTVEFEFCSEIELRNLLFFDSGLYMGLGISLVFGGIHEALKIVAESKRKRTE